ncbi:MAG: cell division protein ZapA [Saprospiraceae bacterium]|nr:cell division protein ZapA [Saprospiraceae bacterium]
MSDNDLINVSVNLAGRSYPILVSENELSSIEKINAKLNEEFIALKTQYANKLNEQDILAMLLLTYAKNLHEEKQINDLTPVEKRIRSIEKILTQVSDK